MYKRELTITIFVLKTVVKKVKLEIDLLLIGSSHKDSAIIITNGLLSVSALQIMLIEGCDH